MTNTDIVKKLVGNIQPAGDTDIDNERFENLKAMCELVNDLATEIGRVAEQKNRYEYSIKQMAEFANNFLTNIMGIGK